MPKGELLQTHIGPLRVVSEDDDLPVNELVAVLGQDGHVRLPAPPLLAGLSANQREAAIMAALWLKATRGSIDASRAWLQHHRWRREMRSGRARQQSALEQTQGVVLIDDLGVPPGESPTSMLLEPGKAEDTDLREEEEKRALPAGSAE